MVLCFGITHALLSKYLRLKLQKTFLIYFHLKFTYTGNNLVASFTIGHVRKPNYDIRCLKEYDLHMYK